MRTYLHHALIVAMVSLLLAGCFTSRSLKTLEAEISQNSQQVTALEDIEKADSEKAFMEYSAFLKKEANFNKPLKYYQDQLRIQLRQMGSSDVQVLGDNALAGFPFYFHMRLGTLVKAHLGLARLHLERNDLTAAEKSAKDAMDIINRRARSNLFMAREGSAIQKLLRTIYERNGSSGKALLAKLNEELFENFLRSEYASEEIARHKEATERAHDQIQQIDRFVSKVNRQRTAKTIAELASAVSEVAGGLDIGDTALQQTTKALSFSMEVVAVTLTASLGGPSGQGVESTLSPMANNILISQLLEPKMGRNSEKIIKDFVSVAVRTNGTDKVRRAAEEVLAGVDALLAARDQSDTEKMSAIKKFAEAFTALQSQVQGFHATI